MTERFTLKHAIPVIIFFSAIFCLNTTPIEDGDLFWHVRTGQWIWEHKALPHTDPFTYTVAGLNPFRLDSQRIQFILKQYWLGQLALFGIWKIGNEAGIVLFRALTYTGILAFLYGWMRKQAQGITPLFLVFLTGSHFLSFPSERPQLFGFLFFPLLLYLLEKIRLKGNNPPGLSVALLPLLMLVWANTHGSFILGVIVIGIYLFTLPVLHFLRKETYSKSAMLSLAFAVIISSLNPCGFDAFMEIFATKRYYSAAVVENISPVAAILKFQAVYYAYWTFLAIAILTIAICIRKAHPTHVLLLLALSLLSLTAMRHTPFLLLAAPVLLCYINEKEFRYKYIGATALLLVWIALADWKNRFRLESVDFFPKKAVQFIRSARPAPQLFNNYAWGGYLINYLPEYPVFIDGRGLIEELFYLYGRSLMTQEWRKAFDSFNVNTVIMPGFNRLDGTKYQLPLDLINDSSWFLVFQDASAMVFVRNIPENAHIIKKYAIPKSAALQHYNMLKELIENN